MTGEEVEEQHRVWLFNQTKQKYKLPPTWHNWGAATVITTVKYHNPKTVYATFFAMVLFSQILQISMYPRKQKPHEDVNFMHFCILFHRADNLKAYSQISYWGRSQKIQNLIFLHLIVALLQEAHFPKGMKQKPFLYQMRVIFCIKSCRRDLIFKHSSFVMHNLIA